MKPIPYIPILTVFLFAGLFGGCNSLNQDTLDSALAYWEQAGFGSQEEEEAATDGEVSDPTEEAIDDSVDPETDTSGSSVLLWKPEAESRGGVCVILLPKEIRQSNTYQAIEINGVECSESNGGVHDWRDGYANGNRIHVFLDHKGAVYGAPVTVSVPLRDGTKREWTVPDGALLYETR